MDFASYARFLFGVGKEFEGFFADLGNRLPGTKGRNPLRIVGRGKELQAPQSFDGNRTDESPQMDFAHGSPQSWRADEKVEPADKG